jgi:hypothetical protein
VRGYNRCAKKFRGEWGVGTISILLVIQKRIMVGKVSEKLSRRDNGHGVI